MTESEKQFLYLFKCGIKGEAAAADYEFDVGEVFSLASAHSVMPVIFAAVMNNNSEQIALYKRKFKALVGSQMSKNESFRLLYSDLIKNDFSPVLLKGPVCAVNYPVPDYRLSSDFDVYISEADKMRLYSYLENNGYSRKNEAFFCEENSLYIEIKTALGEGSDDFSAKTDRLFNGFEQRLVTVGGYKTLSYTDNMLYLIVHALKHFIGSGFGVRQTADIILFAEKNKNEIDFEYVFKKLGEINGDVFALNVFKAAEKFFGFDFSYIYNVLDINGKKTYEDEFMEDLLAAGVFGKRTQDRLHSAGAVTASVDGGGKLHSFASSVFPSYSAMKNRYPVLKYLPILLPLFWIVRLIKYSVKMVFGKNKVSPSESVKIANNRIELMKKTGIIK